MLTGEVLPDAGDALVGGHSVRRALGAARRQLGYCPQFEALPGAMTGREVLAMYARWARGLATGGAGVGTRHTPGTVCCWSLTWLATDSVDRVSHAARTGLVEPPPLPAA